MYLAYMTFRPAKLPASDQERLLTLMAKNNDGSLTEAEQVEFTLLGEKAEQLSLENARSLAAAQQSGSNGDCPKEDLVAGGTARICPACRGLCGVLVDLNTFHPCQTCGGVGSVPLSKD